MKPDTRSYYAQAVQRVIEQIATHLDEAPSLGELAREACLSPFHFHKVFRGMTGETPLEMLRRLRMERATWQLLHTDRPVTAIAFDAGYETHESFTRAFRACHAMSPSKFRGGRHRRTQLAAANGIHYSADASVPAFIPRDSGGRAMQVDIRKLPAFRVATVHHVGPYNRISEAFEKLGATAAPAGLLELPDTQMVALYYDDPESTPSEELQSDAGLIVAEGAKLPADVGEQHLLAGPYACTMHVGGYETLGDTWARLMGEWLPASGHRAGDGPSYEVYLNTPHDTPKDQLRTEIRFLLAEV